LWKLHFGHVTCKLLQFEVEAQHLVSAKPVGVAANDTIGIYRTANAGVSI
jgi:hypothetical protein